MSDLILFKSNSLTCQYDEAKKSVLASEANDKQLKAVFFQIFMLIGIREPLGEIQSNILISFTKRNLGAYRIHEFILAYEMAIKGRLNVELEHYQNFNSVYLTSVMNAYRMETQKIEAKRKENEELPKIELSENEKRQIIVDGILSAYEQKKKGIYVQDAGNPKYNLLDELKIINFSLERKNEIYASAEAKYRTDLVFKAEKGKDELHVKKMLAEIGRGVINDDAKTQIISLAKEIAINDFLSDCVQMDLDLDKIIKSKL